MKTLAFLANGRRIKRHKSMEVPNIRYWDIYECYSRPSIFKVKAWEEIVKVISKNNGQVGIINYTTRFFTCGGYFFNNGKKVHFILTEKYLYYNY